MLSKLLGLWLVTTLTINLTLATTQLRLTQNLVKSYKDIPEVCQQTSQPCGDLTFIQEAYDRYYGIFGSRHEEDSGSASNEETGYCVDRTKIANWLTYHYAEDTSYMRLLGDIHYVQCQQGVCEDRGCIDGWKHACTTRWSTKRLSVLRYYNHGQPEEGLCYKGWCVETVRLTFPKHCQCQKSIYDCDASHEDRIEDRGSGVWGPWSDWGTCSCSVGIQYSSRVCHRGDCKGNSRKSQKCDGKDCTVYLQGNSRIWGAWGSWSRCRNCNSWQSRKRNCHGRSCQGSSVENRLCSQSPQCTGTSLCASSLQGTCEKPCSRGTVKQTGKGHQNLCTPGYFCCVGQTGGTNPQCGSISRPSNGQMYGSGNDIGDTRTFRCNTGYSLVGQSTVTCVRQGSGAGWSSSAPTCQANPQCGSISRPSNGQMSGSGNDIGDTRTFRCNTGYSLVGQSTVTCVRQGSGAGWSSSAPTCQEVSCNNPGTPTNGQRVGNDFSFGSSVSFTCNSGYDLNGAATITCQATGDWSNPTPTCVIKRCPQPTAPQNGQVTGGSPYNVGATITYGCNAGYNRVGSATRRCQDSGSQATWSGQAPTCTYPVQCGKRGQSIAGRIVGGTIADRNAWPWMVELRHSTSGSLATSIHYCGGVLISSTVVLTAAHCTVDSGLDLAAPNRLYQWHVILGEHDLSVEEGTETRHTVTRIIRHASFRQLAQYHNDVALFVISPPATYNNAIQPICLPTQDYTGSGSGVVTGWGSTDPSGTGLSLLLMQLYAPFIATTTCNSAIMYNGEILDGMICAGFAAGGRDACLGDSGGPLVYYHSPSDTYYVAGLVSWGRGCATANRPGVYTHVYYYASWIQNNMP